VRFLRSVYGMDFVLNEGRIIFKIFLQNVDLRQHACSREFLNEIFEINVGYDIVQYEGKIDSKIFFQNVDLRGSALRREFLSEIFEISVGNGFCIVRKKDCFDNIFTKC